MTRMTGLPQSRLYGNNPSKNCPIHFGYSVKPLIILALSMLLHLSYCIHSSILVPICCCSISLLEEQKEAEGCEESEDWVSVNVRVWQWFKVKDPVNTTNLRRTILKYLWSEQVSGDLVGFPLCIHIEDNITYNIYIVLTYGTAVLACGLTRTYIKYLCVVNVVLTGGTYVCYM